MIVPPAGAGLVNMIVITTDCPALTVELETVMPPITT